MEFAQKVTFTHNPLNVTIDIIDLDKANYRGVVLTQIYSVTNDKTVPLSTDDFTKSTVALYPNPVVNSFKIDTEQDIKNVQVYGINGRLLKSATTYDISDLSSGLYLVIINTFSGSETIKILKHFEIRNEFKDSNPAKFKGLAKANNSLFSKNVLETFGNKRGRVILDASRKTID